MGSFFLFFFLVNLNLMTEDLKINVNIWINSDRPVIVHIHCYIICLELYYLVFRYVKITCRPVDSRQRWKKRNFQMSNIESHHLLFILLLLLLLQLVKYRHHSFVLKILFDLYSEFRKLKWNWRFSECEKYEYMCVLNEQKPSQPFRTWVNIYTK